MSEPDPTQEDYDAILDLLQHNDPINQDEIMSRLALSHYKVNKVLLELNLKRKLLIGSVRKKGKKVTTYSVRRS